MTMDIMKLVTGAVTPMLASKVAGAFGVPDGAVRKLMSVGVPVILSSLLKRSSTAGGMDAIGAALGGMGRDPLDRFGNALSGDAAQVSAAAQGGSDMLSSLFGVGAAGGLAKTLGAYAGVDEKVAGPLLGLAGASALGGLKTVADTQGLDGPGVMRLLATQRDQIDRGIPADLGRMLSSSGLLPQAVDVANATRTTTTSVPPRVEESNGWLKWLLGALALAAAVWLASQFFGPKRTPVVTETPAVAPATTEQVVVNPLVVDGVNIGDSIQGVLTNLTGTLAGVKDAASATAAVTALTDADTALGGLKGAIGSLNAEGKTALQKLIGGALPALRTTTDGLLADSAIGAILKPVLDGILAKLTTYGG
jgi:hypothetical protein